MWQLILFRGLQGLGAGALFPIALAVIGDLFTPAERGKYQGLFGAVFGIAFLVGPGLGGFLTDNFSWHWIFFVNLPIGIVALAVIARLLPNIKSRRRDIKIDYAGVITLTLGLMPILVGLTLAETSPWSDPACGARSPRASSSCVDLHLRRVAGGRADHPAPPLPEPDVQRIDGRDLPGHIRLRRRDHLPAALLPDRPGLERHGCRATSSCRS